jgi:hypothetical protein
MGLYKLCEHKGRVRDRCNHAWWGGYRRDRVSLSRWANREIHSKDEATAVLQELRAAVRAGTFDNRGLDVPREAAPLTFKECTDRYKERHVVAKGLALAKTIDYRLKPLFERFADCGLAEIRTADIEDFIADLRKPRAGRSNRTRSVARRVSRAGTGMAAGGTRARRARTRSGTSRRRIPRAVRGRRGHRRAS